MGNFSLYNKAMKKQGVLWNLFLSTVILQVGILLLLLFIQNPLQSDFTHLKLHPQPIYLSPATYPLLPQAIEPNISAIAAIIMDADSHTIIYQKNGFLRFSPASTTKIMTALVSLDYFQPDDVLTVKQLIDTEGSGLGLFVGETFSYKDLLKAALIYSANDAAATIAQNYPGGNPAFVAAMNSKAQTVHLMNTHFYDPDGLDDTQNYTTAEDLVRLSAIAMENPLFADIVKTNTTTIYSRNTHAAYTFQNRNILLGYDGVNGIKTGYTDEAGEVLATSAVSNGHTFYIIVMKSNDRFGDTERLLSLLPSVTYIPL